MPQVRAISSTLTKRAVNYVFADRGAKTFQLALSEVCLATPLALALLYQIGKGEKRGDGTPKTKLLTALGEAGIVHTLVEKTNNVYPLLGLGWASYEMGTAPTNLDKLKAGIKAAVMIPLGYVAIHLGLGITDGLRYRDAKRMMTLMEPLKPLMDASAASASGNVVQKELQPLLALMHRDSQQFLELFKGNNMQMSRIKSLVANMEKSQGAFLSKMGTMNAQQLDSALGPATRKTLQTLSQEIGSVQGYKLLRFLNPWFAYVLAVSLLGPAILKGINKAFLPASPLAQQPDMKVGPLWLDKVIGTGNGLGPVHTHPFMQADGPALLNNSWEGSQGYWEGARN